MAEDPDALEWRYETARDLDQTLIDRLQRFPREPDLTVHALRSLAALVLRAWLRVYHRLEITGREHLPQQGSFVMVSNHASHLDALCLLSALPLRQIHHAFPAAASDCFFVSAPRIVFSAIVVNALPFDRLSHPARSLDLCRRLLANPDNILIIFPEGTRSTTGEVGRFMPGIGLVVAGTSTPVVPCHLAGTFEAWPKGASVPKPRRVRLALGMPRTYAALDPGREAAIEIAHDLREAVLQLRRSHEHSD